MVYKSLEDLTEPQKILLSAAEEAMEHAYSPYSKFKVGCAIRAEGSHIITGANYETASYTGIHGEEATISAASMQGHWKYEAMAIITRGEEFDTQIPTSSCGHCRQLLKEAMDRSGADIEMIFSTTKKDKIRIVNVSELLPDAFGPADLGIDLTKYRK